MKKILLTAIVISIIAISGYSQVGFSTSPNFDYVNINQNALLVQTGIVPSSYDGITINANSKIAFSYYLSVFDLAQRIDQAFHFRIPFDQTIDIKNSQGVVKFKIRKVMYSNDGLRMVVVTPVDGNSSPKRCIFLTNGAGAGIGSTGESVYAADLAYRGYAIAFYENAGSSALSLDNGSAYTTALGNGNLYPRINTALLESNVSLKSPFLGTKYCAVTNCTNCVTSNGTTSFVGSNNNTSSNNAGGSPVYTTTYKPSTILRNVDYGNYLYNNSETSLAFSDKEKTLSAFYFNYLAGRTAYFYLINNLTTFNIDGSNIFGCGGSLGSATTLLVQYLNINNTSTSNNFYDNIGYALNLPISYNASFPFSSSKYPSTFYNPVNLKGCYVIGSGIPSNNTELGSIIDAQDINKPVFAASGAADGFTPPTSAVFYDDVTEGPLLYKDRLNVGGNRYNIYINCTGHHPFQTPIIGLYSGGFLYNVRNGIKISNIVSDATAQTNYLNMTTINETTAAVNIINFLSPSNLSATNWYRYIISLLQVSELNKKAATFLNNVSSNISPINSISYLQLNMQKNKDAIYYLDQIFTSCYPIPPLGLNNISCLSLKYNLNQSNIVNPFVSTTDKQNLFNIANTTSPYILHNILSTTCDVLPANYIPSHDDSINFIVPALTVQPPSGFVPTKFENTNSKIRNPNYFDFDINKTQDFLNVNIKMSFEDYSDLSYVLYDILGNKVCSGNLTNSNQQIELNKTILKTKFYILSIYNNGELLKSKKIIIY